MSWATNLGGMLLALAAMPARAEGPPLAVTAGFGAAGSVSTADAVMLTLSRPLVVAEGRLAILVGATDWTDLFTVRGTMATFTPGPVSLPPGTTEVTAYLVAPGG